MSASENLEARLSVQTEDGTWIGPDGVLMVETPGLSEDLRLLRSVLKAQRDGIELFPGQQQIAPLLTGLFDKPLQVFVAGEFKASTASGAGVEELYPFELAKPAEGVAAAVAAIRALNSDR